MPDGKCSLLGVMKPRASRSPCQQSSMLTYWYPAAFMPVETMASAVSRIICSFTLQPNLFQLFQPSAGVLERPSNFCAKAGAALMIRPMSISRKDVFIVLFLIDGHAISHVSFQIWASVSSLSRLHG